MQEIIKELPIEGIKELKPVSGGDVNAAYHVITDKEDYFLLVQANASESFYTAEIVGLELFEEHGIRGPRVIAHGQAAGDAYLLLSYLEEGHQGSQAELGQLVAKLHQVSSPNGQFGFDYPYAGAAISFANQWTDSWRELFINERMDQLSQALLDQGLWSEDDMARYQEARQVMVEALDNHASQAVLVHGDLWAGNYMFLSDGAPALFDPSPLYGDREFDLGITTVFGGYTEEFYQAYSEILPLEDGYQLRLEFYRLYLFMIHLLKFGQIYAGSVKQSLNHILAEK
ncbi:fructosamine kinase family protein [Aerococcus kribbianus]|uniref:Fructosamine kinase family protein n=1 Tax=Aerococcus kribbianus TaxID=2999064 RepID=A0A9X3FMY1_9LACT|nr:MULTISPECIES: fructosamine kinase family protein [unclassified Aerococcus]MCZ0717435.1 fructosamine kinase family protein [Aerococcus sp. YH-aer221]MCZ0725723.1 fructosamine kinase family protein [Aerococcus sp. YH-aer222]